MMDYKKIFILAAALVLLVTPSCKKDKDDEVVPFLDGNLAFSMPLFVLQGESITLVPSGASNPKTGNVGYAWACSWNSKRDTVKRETAAGNGSWTFTTPTTVGNYSVTGYAFATDFTSLSTSKDFCVVNPTVNTTLTGTGYNLDSLTFKDPRDGGTYYLTKAGGDVWMQNNLYYQGSGVSYEWSPAVDQLFGRLYTWNEAVKACPDGWHLPSDAEFAKLAGTFVKDSNFTVGETFEGAAGALMADVRFIDTKMWAYWPDVKITNESKFSAIPVGYGIEQNTSRRFTGTNSYAVFWTSNDDGNNALYRYIYVDKNNLFCSKGDKESFRASVRCVKD